MILDELNKRFEALNNSIEEANIVEFYLSILSKAPNIIIPGFILSTTDKSGNEIIKEKLDDMVVDTSSEIQRLVEWIEDAMILLKEYKKQADKLENTIDGLIEYAENEARVGEYDNIIGAKAIGHAIEIKFLNGYIPQDRYKQFEKRLKNIRHLSSFAYNMPRNSMSNDAVRPTPQPIAESNEPEEELDETTKMERVKEAITQLKKEKFGDTKTNFQKSNWYAVYFVFEKKIHPNMTPKTFSDLMKNLELTNTDINSNISHAPTTNLPAQFYKWKDYRYTASAAEKKQIDVALRFEALLKEKKVL